MYYLIDTDQRDDNEESFWEKFQTLKEVADHIKNLGRVTDETSRWLLIDGEQLPIQTRTQQIYTTEVEIQVKSGSRPKW